MKRWAFAPILLLLAATAPAQNERFFHPIPPSSELHTRPGVPYARSNGQDVRMDFYRPAGLDPASRAPVLVFTNTLPGRSQRGDALYVGWASAATAHGLAAVVADAAADLEQGFDALLAHLRQHAEELRVDPERVAVFAASGNVVRALPLVQDPERTAVKAAVLYYGAAESVTFRPDLPVLFVRAGLDRPGVNREFDEMVAAAVRSNAPVRLINHPGGHHAFEMLDDDDATRDVIDRTCEFVVAALDPGYQAALRAGIPEARAAGAVLQGDYPTAASLYAEIVARRPDDPRLRLSFGEALLGARRYREARAQFDRLKGAGLGPRDLGLPAARAAAADGDPEDAIAWLKTIPPRFLPREIATDPAFETLRGREDFRALFR